MTSFDKFVHDFGMLSRSRHTWMSIPKEDIQQLIAQAPRGWWRNTLRILIRDNITKESHDRMQNRARKVPQWLLYGDHRAHYLGRIPRDIRGIIYGYFARAETNIIGEESANRVTTFFGALHSFDGYPAFVSRSYDMIHYSWYNLGRCWRASNRPHVIEVRSYSDTLIWLKGGTCKILKRQRGGVLHCNTNEIAVLQGENSAVECTIKHFLRGLNKYKV